MTARLLVVDDDANLRRMLRALLEPEGYDVCEAASGTEAVALSSSADPEVVLLDLVMPSGPDGLNVLEQIRQRQPDAVVVMMSGKASLADAVRATKLGALQFLEKPLSPESVLTTVAAARALFDARADARALRAQLPAPDEMLGDSAAIATVRTLIGQVAATASRVLITGESGTGKELVARAIHAHSPRRDRPIVSVNCAAIPRDLVESDLFGHERGAFTGAHQRHLGKFELAHGGTLFLDEVGDLPEPVQAKLLRTLETGAIERVGSERERLVDVRLMAATNKVLKHEVERGRFRDDLFYRLNVFPIHVPPLRERLEDIAVLAQHFLRRAAARCARRPRHISKPALGRLRAHHWPGNVRELANLMERLTILGGAQPIAAAEVDAAIDPHRAGPPHDGTSLRGRLDAYEARLIHDALGAAAGNVAAAARSLGTDRANLYRRMRRLGIEHR